ncbi:unnamed protein product, partial [Mesorhabditis spiculigera]
MEPSSSSACNSPSATPFTDYGADPNSKKRIARVHKKNTRGETPLHLAARKGDTEACSRMLDEATEADWVNVADYAGWTALHEACVQSRFETAEMLIRRGANVNQSSLEELTTPLHDAAGSGHTSIVWLLLKNGAERNVQDSRGKLPIHLAREGSLVEKMLRSAELPATCPKDESRLVEEDEGNNVETLKDYTCTDTSDAPAEPSCMENVFPLSMPRVEPGQAFAPTASTVTGSITQADVPIIPMENLHASMTAPPQPAQVAAPAPMPQKPFPSLIAAEYDDDDEEESRLLIEENDEDEKEMAETATAADGGEEQQINMDMEDRPETGMSKQSADPGDESRMEEPEQMDTAESDRVKEKKLHRVARQKASRTSTPVPGSSSKDGERKRGTGRGRGRGGRRSARGGSCASSPRASRGGEQDIYEFKDSPESQEDPRDRESSAPPTWKRMRLDDEASGGSNGSGSSPTHNNGQQVPVLRITLNKGSDDEATNDAPETQYLMTNRNRVQSLRGGKTGYKRTAPSTREGTPAIDEESQSRMTRSRIRQSGKTIEEPDYWGKSKKKRNGGADGKEDEDEAENEEEKEARRALGPDYLAEREENLGIKAMLYDSTKSRIFMKEQLVSRWIDDSNLDTARTLAADNTMPPNYPQYMLATNDRQTDITWYKKQCENHPLVKTLDEPLMKLWQMQQEERNDLLAKIVWELARSQMHYEREYLRHYRRMVCGPTRMTMCRMLRDLEVNNTMTLCQPGHPEDEPCMTKEDYEKRIEEPIREMYNRHRVNAVAISYRQREQFKQEALKFGIDLLPELAVELAPEVPTRLLEFYLNIKMVSAEIEPTAYATMILHCVKYPSKGVSGLLLGKKTAGKLEISSVVPLVHESAPLSPSLEVALTLVSAKEEVSILGVYYSNQSCRDKGLNTHAVRLAEKIAAVTDKPAYVAQVVNWHLSADCSSPCVSMYTLDGSSWKDMKVDVEPSALSLVSNALQRKVYRELVDFENHLDNPELDFYNARLTQMLEGQL